MIFNVDKDEAIRALEVIIETQQNETEGIFGNCTEVRAKYLLDLLLKFPLKCSKVMLTEEECVFISDFYQ